VPAAGAGLVIVAASGRGNAAPHAPQNRCVGALVVAHDGHLTSDMDQSAADGAAGTAYFFTGAGGCGGGGMDAWSMMYTILPSRMALTSEKRPSTT
jgi:hypothetical protein